MNQPSTRDLRLATIGALAQRLGGGMGRTALMKLIYFLQVLKKLPLGYSFRLYTYGPFDAQVLEDLKVAEMKGLVQSAVFSYPGGYGYAISPRYHAESSPGVGLSAPEATRFRQEGLAAYEEALDWVVREFGQRSALDLEMASTIVYVDRATAAKQAQLSPAEIARKVEEIKPRLEFSRIETEAESLKKRGLLIATI